MYAEANTVCAWKTGKVEVVNFFYFYFFIILSLCMKVGGQIIVVYVNGGNY